MITRLNMRKTIKDQKFFIPLIRLLAVGVALLMCFGSSPALALSVQGASAPNGSEKVASEKRFPELTREISLYVKTDGSERIYFDRDAANRGGAAPEVLEAGRKLNEISVANDNGESGVMRRAISLPIWGNWCGPGHGSGSAVDVLDSICRTHDKCYGSRGYFACSCDRAIVSDIGRNASRMKAKERSVAAAVSVYFTYCACNPFK